MTVREIMSTSPATCTSETHLDEVARLMYEHDCGAIPVVGTDGQTQRPVGIVTDRDIVVRCLAKGQNPLERVARDVMTGSAITIREDADLDECARAMEDHQIRRIVVVGHDGKITGIVAQADLALNAADEMTGRVVEDISQPPTL
jgi:CBS domain-containing protein